MTVILMRIVTRVVVVVVVVLSNIDSFVNLASLGRK